MSASVTHSMIDEFSRVSNSFPTQSQVESLVPIGSDLIQSRPISRRSYVHLQEADKYLSSIEEAIINASNPIPIDELEEINLDGIRGLLLNKEELSHWTGLIPLNLYDINHDPNPEIINKKPSQELEYHQEIAIRYLKPPTPSPPGDIIIEQESNITSQPAPPLVIRQPPPPPEESEPIIIREAPPQPPPQIPPRKITIKGKRLPPPPRKVVIEKFEQLPPKPQQVLIERWLPYIPQKRRVIFQAAPPDPIVAPPKNLIIQWQAPLCVVKKQITYLGVVRADPVEYLEKYGSSIRSASQLPDIVNEIKTPENLLLAANVEYSGLHELEGDVDALKLVDLEHEGLAEYKNYLDHFNNRPATSNPSVAFISHSASVSGSATTDSHNLVSASAVHASESIMSAPVTASAQALPYRAITSLTSFSKLDELGFPRPNSAVYGSGTVTTVENANLSDSAVAVISSLAANSSHEVGVSDAATSPISRLVAPTHVNLSDAATSTTGMVITTNSTTDSNFKLLSSLRSSIDFSASSRAITRNNSRKGSNISGFILRSRNPSSTAH